MKRQITLKQESKEKKALIAAQKKMSFASMTNSNFNLSFKDKNIQSDIHQKPVDSSPQSTGSGWMEVVERKNSTFGRKKTMLKNLETFADLKVSTHPFYPLFVKFPNSHRQGRWEVIF